MARSPWSSMGASVQAYLPYYAPPVDPQTNYITGGGASAMTHPQFQTIDEHTRMVNRMPRMLGIRWLYARGGQIKPWFRMISTGAVESSKFQPVLSYQWSGEYNDAIYEAGYPRNLGYSFKVDTIPAGAKRRERSEMLPRPRITRPIFSRRAYTSGVKPLPAVSAYGRGQTNQRGR